MRWLRVVLLCVGTAAVAACDTSAPGDGKRSGARRADTPENAPNPRPEGVDPSASEPVVPPTDAVIEGAGECDERQPERCFELARGLPAGADTRQLVALLEPACAGGVSQACYALSAVLRKGGAGVPADPARAKELAQQACRQGSQVACDALGH